MKLKLFGFITFLTVAVAIAMQFDLSFKSPDSRSLAKELAALAPDDSLFYIASSGTDNLSDDYDKTILHDVFEDEYIKSLLSQAIHPESIISKHYRQTSEYKEIRDKIIDLKLLQDPSLFGLVVDSSSRDIESANSYVYYITPGDQAKLNEYIKVLKEFNTFANNKTAIEVVKYPEYGNVIILTGDIMVYRHRPVLCLCVIDKYIIAIATLDNIVEQSLVAMAKSISSRSETIECFKSNCFQGDDIIFMQNNEFVVNQFKNNSYQLPNEIIKYRNLTPREQSGKSYYRFSFKDRQTVIDAYDVKLEKDAFLYETEFFNIDSNFFPRFKKVTKLNRKLLSVIPADVTGMAAFNYDYKTSFITLMNSSVKFGEITPQEMQRLAANIKELVGDDFLEGIFNNLTWAMLVTVKADDAVNLRNNNITCILGVNDSGLFIQALNAQVKDKERVDLSVKDCNGVDLYSFSYPVLSDIIKPSIFALDANNIVLSTSEQAAVEMISLWQSQDISKSILSSPKFVRATKDLPENIYYMHYLDSETLWATLNTALNKYLPYELKKDITSRLNKDNSEEFDFSHLYKNMPADICWLADGGMFHLETDGVVAGALANIIYTMVENIIFPEIRKEIEKLEARSDEEVASIAK